MNLSEHRVNDPVPLLYRHLVPIVDERGKHRPLPLRRNLLPLRVVPRDTERKSARRRESFSFNLPQRELVRAVLDEFQQAKEAELPKVSVLEKLAVHRRRIELDIDFLDLPQAQVFALYCPTR